MEIQKEIKPVIVAFTLDFETGGLKCQTSACTQIAIHATRLDTFERLGSYVKYIHPYNQKEIKGVTEKRKILKGKFEVGDGELMGYEAKALEYSAITMDMLYSMGEKIEDVANGVLQFIIKHTPKISKGMRPFLIGQNVEFDKGFFMQMMEYAGLTKEVSKYLKGSEDFYGHWQPLTLDTILLGQLALCHLPAVNSYKLELMCEHLGVELNDAHDADADVSATTNVVAVLTQRMRSIGGTADGGEIAMTRTEKSRKHFKI
jgi:DNA polymerase III epsilon subunit-like protein